MSTNHDETCDCISQTHPAGIHLCYIYNDDEERRQVMARFVNTGIDAGELVAYFADVEGSVEEYLEGMGIHLPTAGRNGQLRTLRAREVYAPDGQFLPDRMLDNLRSFHDECKDSLYPAVRITGETTWTLNDVPGCDRFIEYEARINSILADHPAAIICQYDARRFDGAAIYDILSVHPMMIVRGQIVQNPYYLPPEEFLRRRQVASESRG